MSYFVNITAWTIHIKAICHISVIWYLILNSIVNLRDDRILEAVVSFYRIDSETAIERHRSRLPINDVTTVLAQKHLNSFLGLKELSSKYGLGDFDVELYHMATFQFICSLSDDLLSNILTRWLKRNVSMLRTGKQKFVCRRVVTNSNTLQTKIESHLAWEDVGIISIQNLEKGVLIVLILDLIFEFTLYVPFDIKPNMRSESNHW